MNSFRIKRAIILIIISVLCVSCGVHKNLPQITQRDTTYIYKNNTEYIHDSINVFRDRIIKEKGDTVYITETLYKDRYKYKYKTDTLYKDRIKEVEKEVIKEVEKKLSFWQSLWIRLGKILSCLAILGGIVIFVKTKLRVKL